MTPRHPLLLAVAAQALRLRFAASLTVDLDGGRDDLELARADDSRSADFSAEIPALVANDGECDLCASDQQWLFVLSTGHSGATSLTEILNKVPGFYIAGENMGIMDILLDEYDSLGKIVKRSERGEPGWQTKPISQRHVLCAMQAVMRTAIGDFKEGQTSVVGFKEVRHTSRSKLDFFKKVFPCARFILSSQTDLAISSKALQMHASSPAGNADLEQLQNATREFGLWLRRHPENAFNVRMEDLSPRGMNELLSWLGVRGCRFSAVEYADEADILSDNVVPAKVEMTGTTCHFERWA